MAAPNPRAGRGPESPEDRTRRMARERKQRQRNRRRAAAEGANIGPEDAKRDPEVERIIGKNRDEIVKRVFAEELRPVVRDAIDQDAVAAIQGMVGLVPAAILVLAEGLQSQDEVVRQRSAALIAKYTLGNPLATPGRADTGDKLVIINALPRSDTLPSKAIESTSADMLEASSYDDSEMRRCDTCRLWKPLEQFPGDGPRCEQCLLERKEQIVNAFLDPEERARLLSEHAVRESEAAEDVQRPSSVGGPEVREASPGLQPGDVRPSGLVENRIANLAGHESISPPPRPEALRGASEIFPGPRDPKRWSTGH